MNAGQLTLQGFPQVKPHLLLRAAVVASLAIFGAVALRVGLRELRESSSVIAWDHLIQGLLWIALGAAAWIWNPSAFRRIVALLLIAAGFTSAFIIIQQRPSTPPIFESSAALVWSVLGVGVWNGREWARRGCVIFGLGVGGFQLILLAFTLAVSWPRSPDGWFIYVSEVILNAPLFAGPTVALALYAEVPTTRQHFAAVRAGLIS